MQLSRHQDDHLVYSFEIPDRNCLRWCATTSRSRSPNSHHPPSNAVTYMENRTQAHNFTSSSEIATSILRNVWTFCQVTTQHPTPPSLPTFPDSQSFGFFLDWQRRDMDDWEYGASRTIRLLLMCFSLIPELGSLGLVLD